MAVKKGAILAESRPTTKGLSESSLSLLAGGCPPERPGAVKGASLLGRGGANLDSEDRSEMIAKGGKAGK
jgi:hypothetical protein